MSHCAVRSVTGLRVSVTRLVVGGSVVAVAVTRRSIARNRRRRGGVVIVSVIAVVVAGGLIRVVVFLPLLCLIALPVPAIPHRLVALVNRGWRVIPLRSARRGESRRDRHLAGCRKAGSREPPGCNAPGFGAAMLVAGVGGYGRRHYRHCYQSREKSRLGFHLRCPLPSIGEHQRCHRALHGIRPRRLHHWRLRSGHPIRAHLNHGNAARKRFNDLLLFASLTIR